MNFSKRRRGFISVKNEEARYPNRLMLYKDTPVGEISLEEFEGFAVDRLKLLREVENISIRFKRGSNDYINKMRKGLKDLLPQYFETPTSDASVGVRIDKIEKQRRFLEGELADRRKDHLSHFILRLAFARSEDLRRWFLTQELDLFRFRFQEESNEQTNMFLKESGLEFNAIDDETKLKLQGNLKDSMYNAEIHHVSENEFYKVPFTDVLDLVRSRKVFLLKGYAYVPRQELVSIIIGKYRSHLSHALVTTARKIPYLEEDNRLLPMLKNLSNAYVGDSFTSKDASDGDKLQLNEIEQVSKASFPICMRNLHEGLRSNHHLKHFGRLQYGLFLKTAGLSLDDALKFWRSEFTKTMDTEKFEKQYAYNVRHSYGKEGKRADYSPYSCLKIITSNHPGPGDFHGCPFKHSDADVLRRRLQKYKLPQNETNEILHLVKSQHYQVACARYFEVTHKIGEGTMSINHPNEFYVESRKIFTGKEKSNSSLSPNPTQSSNSLVDDAKKSSATIIDAPPKDDEYNLDEEMDVL